MIYVKKIISGGQTGADRAALDFAMAHDIPYHGWVPKGGKTEDGRLPQRYRLTEMPTTDYSKRTEQNVLDSDATVILSHGLLTGGSALTREFAEQHRKHWLHIDFKEVSLEQAADRLACWLFQHQIEILNVAGPRAGKDPEIYGATWRLLEKTFLNEIKD